MKKEHLKSFLGKLKNEYKETKDMFIFIFSGKGSREDAVEQMKDIFKIIFLSIIFSLPFVGAISTAILLKKFNGMKPSSFR